MRPHKIFSYVINKEGEISGQYDELNEFLEKGYEVKELHCIPSNVAVSSSPSKEGGVYVTVWLQSHKVID